MKRFVWVLLAAACAACSTGAGGGGGGGVPMPADGGGIDGAANDSGGACTTTLANTAPIVAKTTNPGPPPAMTGGTINDGTYFLTRIDKFNGHSGPNTMQQTWRFAGSRVESVQVDSLAPGMELRFVATSSSAATTWTLNGACLGGRTVSFQYTATATQIMAINPDDPNEMHTLTKQ